MKCLVFSDSHNYIYFMEKALYMHKDAEVVFFLGDGLYELEDVYYKFPGQKFFAVKGNCDYTYITMGEAATKTAEIEILGKRIVYTHGDLYGAKYGSAGLESLARERGADVVLYGHTHTPACEYFSEYEKPFYLFNPGSVGGRDGSYGIITLEEGKEPLFSHGNFV